jgi:hypothetical protein
LVAGGIVLKSDGCERLYIANIWSAAIHRRFIRVSRELIPGDIKNGSPIKSGMTDNELSHSEILSVLNWIRFTFLYHDALQSGVKPPQSKALRAKCWRNSEIPTYIAEEPPTLPKIPNIVKGKKAAGGPPLFLHFDISEVNLLTRGGFLELEFLAVFVEE